MADVKKSSTKKSNDLCSQSIMIPQIIQFFKIITDFPKLAEKLSVIRTDRHENLVRPKNILPVRKKSLKKFSRMHNV